MYFCAQFIFTSIFFGQINFCFKIMIAFLGKFHFAKERNFIVIFWHFDFWFLIFWHFSTCLPCIIIDSSTIAIFLRLYHSPIVFHDFNDFQHFSSIIQRFPSIFIFSRQSSVFSFPLNRLLRSPFEFSSRWLYRVFGKTHCFVFVCTLSLPLTYIM